MKLKFKNFRHAAFLLALPFLTASCASLINGSHETVPINVQPAGATIQVGGSQYISPADASLARDRDYQIIASKPGYETQTTELHSSFSGWTLLDTIFIIPWAVDLADGAAYKLEPTTVEMQLQPSVQAAQPAVPAQGAGTQTTHASATAAAQHD
jgi:hypothetical protein